MFQRFIRNIATFLLEERGNIPPQHIPPERATQVRSDETAGPLTQEEIIELSKRIKCTEWKKLGRYLKHTDQLLENIEHDCRWDVQEKVYQMLVKWTQANGSKATKSQVIDGLLNIERKDIVDALFQGCSQSELRCNVKSPQFELSAPLGDLIQKKQRDFYQRLTIPPLSWLQTSLHIGKIYIEQNLHQISSGKLENRGSDLGYLFDGDPKRVILVGPSKVGKTTLIAKLLYDWSMYEKYIAGKFDYVFIIPMRDFQHEKVMDAIFSQCDVEVGEDQKRKTLFRNEEKLLLILDGLEEMSASVKDDVQLFLADRKYSKMTVLATCREIKSFQLPNYGYEYLETTYDHWEKDKIWRKIFLLQSPVGERSSNEKFHEKYFGSKMDPELGSLTAGSDLTKTPLMFLFFASFSEKMNFKANTMGVNSKWELYKRIFQYLVDPGPTSKIDIFDPKTSIYQTMVKLGQTSFEKLLLHQLYFEHDEISAFRDNAMFSFFSQPASFFKQDSNLYEPLHDSFVEMLSAIYLSSLERDELGSKLQALVKSNISWKMTGLLLNFLVGSLQDRSHELFRLIRPISTFQLGVSPQFDSILSDVKVSDQLLSSLAIYMTPAWNLENLDLYPRSQCFLYGIRHEIIQQVEMNTNTFWTYFHAFPDDVLPYLILNLSPNETQPKTCSKQVSCSTLCVKTELCIMEIGHAYLTEVLRVIKYEKIVLQLSQYTSDQTVSSLPLKNLKNWLPTVRLHQLILLSLGSTEFIEVIPILTTMLKNNMIEDGLRISLRERETPQIKDRSEISSFLQNVASSQLKRFFFDDDCTYSLPFSVLSSEGKKWDYLFFTESLEAQSSDTQCSTMHVQHLDCQGLRQSAAHAKASCTRDIKRISCTDGFLQVFEELPTDWTGFETVTELQLRKFKDNLRLSRFQNLTKLSIEFSFLYDTLKADSNIAKLLDTLKRLSLETLEFQHVYQDNVAFIVSLLEKLAQIEIRNTLNDIVVEVEGSNFVENTGFLEVIRKCLVMKKTRCFMIMYKFRSPEKRIENFLQLNMRLPEPLHVRYRPHISDRFAVWDLHKLTYEQKLYYFCLTLR